VTVLDAYAVLAFLRGEAAADAVAALLRSQTLLSAVNAAEVLDQLVRVYGADPDDVHADLGLLSHAGMRINTVSPDVGLFAGRLRAGHYHRVRMPVSLADCVAAATAVTEKRPLATADPALAAMLRTEGGAIHPLPNRQGHLP
jgi:PIN domain nuclease of toxin-antitoxin system